MGRDIHIWWYDVDTWKICIWTSDWKEVSDPGKWSKINLKKKTARITQSSKLRFNINTWLSYISINEDNAQLTKGYYQIATISSIRSTIVASVTSRVNHRLWYSASPLCLISCCSLTPMTLISSQGWQQLSWKWDHTREGLARKRYRGQGV